MLPLIDAYDLLQSDRVNDKQQFADALLVLTGVMGLTAPEDGDGRTRESGCARIKRWRCPTAPRAWNG